MESFWQLLGLEPTKDISAIRRAYAQRARDCHPEENPEGFLQLRQAYQAALDWAEHGDEAPEDIPQDAAEDEGWILPDIPEDDFNPYEDGDAIRQFLDIYTGKQRKNPKLWMDYFTSAAFLDAGWDSRFTALLLKEVTRLEGEYPVNREFVTWLSIAYQLSEGPEERSFDGLDAILRIAAKGPAPKPPKGNEFAILQSFRDYRHLIRLADAGRWDQEVLDAYREVLDRYSQSYIRERCEQRVTPDYERHPVGLRVFLRFFRRDGLPEAVYRYAWQRLDLKSAIMGRAKSLYGPLRERVLEQVPGIAQEAPENFLQLNRNLDVYLAQVKGNPAEEDAISAAFFDSAELQKALPSPRFVEGQLLTYSKWRREGMGEGLVRRLLAFYRGHPDIPRAAEAIAGLEGDLKRQAVKRWNQEDAGADIFDCCEWLSLRYRPFFRHWLNTGFYTARTPETWTPLLEYLENCLPYQKNWSRRFAESGRTAAAAMGMVEVDFHPLHMEFRVNGRPVYRPCLSWEETKSWSAEWFFYMLPITAAPYSLYNEVAHEIFSRLSETAAPVEDFALIASCLAGHVCSLPLDGDTGEPVPPEKALDMELCAEGGGRLYVCTWRADKGPIYLFQQTFSGRRMQRTYQPERGESYMEAARQLLAETVSPTRFDLSGLRELPWNVYYTPENGSEEHLQRPDLMDEESEGAEPVNPVTEEALSSLLVRFGRDELERLEMEWSQGRLVLCRDGGKYACLYFENHFGRGDYWYALLADPEMYRTADGDDIADIPFGMGKLREYSVFGSAAGLMGNMDNVLAQMGWGQLQSGGPGGWLWSCDVNLHNSKHKLLMAQQKMGGVPPWRGRNHLFAKFVFSRYPVRLESEDLKGERTFAELRSGSYGQAAAGLAQFMSERLARLRLTWDFRTEDGGVYYRHMVLLRDNGRFMLFWLQDNRERADAYASDSPVPFLGYLAPACLVHKDLMRIRNCVDLLLDDIGNTGPVTDRPGEFVPISLPYGEIRAELVKEE